MTHAEEILEAVCSFYTESARPPLALSATDPRARLAVEWNTPGFFPRGDYQFIPTFCCRRDTSSGQVFRHVRMEDVVACDSVSVWWLQRCPDVAVNLTVSFAFWSAFYSDQYELRCKSEPVLTFLREYAKGVCVVGVLDTSSCKKNCQVPWTPSTSLSTNHLIWSR